MSYGRTLQTSDRVAIAALVLLFLGVVLYTQGRSWLRRGQEIQGGMENVDAHARRIEEAANPRLKTPRTATTPSTGS